MRSITLNILLALIVRSQATELASGMMGDTSTTMDKFNNMLDKIVDVLFQRALKEASLQRYDLDKATLGKLSNLEVPSPPSRNLGERTKDDLMHLCEELGNRTSGIAPSRLLAVGKPAGKTVGKPGGKKSLHPAELINMIKEAVTIEHLLRIHREHENEMNHIHLSACWTSLGQLARQGKGGPGWDQDGDDDR
eukprot:gnl/MRDRNA2_/MRDRNA2_114218_c0_seq1.p1 gnl/MRDRNA2_/MRDRNA2_114218_c0~~gnl/MRDRNA2_/MRDRNA2_114218_c0_seq1.p1  ORF type:complete len:193 (-),score=45.23 gnl/MRDRNA2_/MRDRNA2_114218_c0_seq1:327-905(-)